MCDLLMRADFPLLHVQTILKAGCRWDSALTRSQSRRKVESIPEKTDIFKV